MSSLIDSGVFLTKMRQALAFDLVPKNEEQAYYRESILKNFDKKFIPEDSTLDTAAGAISLFRSVNDRMRDINMNYATLSEQWKSNSTLRRARNFCAEILGSSPNGLLEEVFLRAKHSNGTSLGVKYMDTSLEAKCTWPLSGSKACVRLWEHYRNWDYELYTSMCNLNETSPYRGEVVTADGSRAATVPKSSKIDRFISVEPTLNMFFQQGALGYLNERLARFGLTVTKDQEVHRSAAWEGSVTGRLATIDFSSMSDSLSLSVCHFMLPKEWYSLLFTLRSHRTTLPGGDVVQLEMMSTMGNATTFPLETLILYCIAESAVATTQGKPVLTRLIKTCRVYGDDCIISTDAAGHFVEVCNMVGFQVNHEKTFMSGPFRESCGGDFYRGRDVRPFYLKSLPSPQKKLEVEAYLYTTINGVIRMYIKYFGAVAYVYDKQLLSYLFSVLSKVTKLVKFVPEDFPDDSGITQLRDIRRLCYAYWLTPSRVGVNVHGMLQFNYLKYEYPNKVLNHEGIRYATLIKLGVLTSAEAHSIERATRKRGFYVECKTSYRDGALIRLPSTLEDSYNAQLAARMCG